MECRKYLNDRFFIAFEIGYKQGNDVINIINKYFDNVNISLEKDYNGRDRFIFVSNINQKVLDAFFFCLNVFLLESLHREYDILLLFIYRL